MVDIVPKETRSRMMRGIRSKNTKPELIIRKALHRKGFRYRLHNKKIPGKPDLSLRRYNALIFVHGCFWHHHGCHLSKLPPDDWWKNKLLGNAERDSKIRQDLLDAGWRVAVVWECAVRGKKKLDHQLLTEKISDWLRSDSKEIEILGE